MHVEDKVVILKRWLPKQCTALYLNLTDNKESSASVRSLGTRSGFIRFLVQHMFSNLSEWPHLELQQHMFPLDALKQEKLLRLKYFPALILDSVWESRSWMNEYWPWPWMEPQLNEAVHGAESPHTNTHSQSHIHIFHTHFSHIALEIFMNLAQEREHSSKMIKLMKDSTQAETIQVNDFGLFYLLSYLRVLPLVRELWWMSQLLT